MYHCHLVPSTLLSSSVVGIPTPETNRDSHSVFKSMRFERSAQQEGQTDLLPSPITTVGLTPSITMPLGEVKATLSKMDTSASSAVHEASPPESGTTKQDEEAETPEVGQVCIEIS